MDNRFRRLWICLSIAGLIVGAVIMLAGCAGFEALFGPTADPAAKAAAQATAMAMVPPPFNLLIPGAIGILTALFAPKEPQL